MVVLGHAEVQPNQISIRSDMIETLNEKPVVIKGKLVPEFIQPVFYNEKYDVYYYVIENPATLRDDPSNYDLSTKVEVGTPYFSLNYSMVENLLKKNKELFVQIKSPDLPYIKGLVLNKSSLEDPEVHIGKEVSKYKTSGNYMFSVSKATTIKEKET